MFILFCHKLNADASWIRWFPDDSEPSDALQASNGVHGHAVIALLHRMSSACAVRAWVESPWEPGMQLYLTIFRPVPLHNRHCVSQFQLFDRSVAEYETVLTPSDFERASELIDSFQYSKYDTEDPDVMYEKDLFEGDIANENASFYPIFEQIIKRLL